MSVIDDLNNAVANYATDKCKTEIVNFSVTSGPGQTLNNQETFQFKVKVINDGSLLMENVTVQANGTQYADVALSTGSFGSHAVSVAFNLDAFQDYTTTGFFRGRAKAVTDGAKDIVTAQIASWDASLRHILVHRTGAGQPEGKLHQDIGRN